MLRDHLTLLITRRVDAPELADLGEPGDVVYPSLRYVEGRLVDRMAIRGRGSSADDPATLLPIRRRDLDQHRTASDGRNRRDCALAAPAP